MPVWEGPYVEASERMRWLEEAHIPVDLGDALVAGQARVEVPPGYESEAREIMRRGPTVIADYPLMDTSSPLFTNWKILIAVIVLVAIVLTLVL